MRSLDVITQSVETDRIILNNNETAARLKIKSGYRNSAIDEGLCLLKEAAAYKFAFIKAQLNQTAPDIFDFGIGSIKSQSLKNALDGCGEVYILGVTLGIAVDRLLIKLSLTSAAKHFIVDALSSAAAEALCDYADDFLRPYQNKPMRFSPGYGDLPLDIQPQITEMLDAKNTLGITLSPSMLMTPSKSITAILGVKK